MAADLDLDIWFRLGSWISKHACLVIICGYASSIVLTGFIFTHGELELDIAKLWVKEGGSLYDELSTVKSNTVTAGKDVVLIDASLVTASGSAATDDLDMLTPARMGVYADFVKSTLLPINSTVLDTAGNEHHVTSRDIFETTAGTYFRMSPVDCYIEGGYDYFGPSHSSCKVGHEFYANLLTPSSLHITPYNWCHYARAHPFASMFIDNDFAAAPKYSPQEQGMCRGFLNADTLLQTQYQELQTLNEYVAFKTYDFMLGQVDLIAGANLKIIPPPVNITSTDDSSAPATPPPENVENCLVIGNPVGDTTTDCCGYFNDVAVLGIMAGSPTGAFSNDMTCGITSASCYDASVLALTLASNMLGTDYVSDFADTCAPIREQLSPPETPDEPLDGAPFDPMWTTMDPTPTCLVLGNDVGTTTTDCCSYFNDVVVPGMLAQMSADMFANQETCLESTCEASARKALTLAKLLLGFDYMPDFDRGCEPFHVPPLPPPPPSTSLPDCTTDDGIHLGNITAECCAVFKDDTYNFIPGGDDYGFTHAASSHACQCLPSVDNLVAQNALLHSFDRNTTFANVLHECKWHTVKTPSAGPYGCNRDSPSHLEDGCRNPFFDIAYYQHPECDVTFEEFKANPDELDLRCALRFDHFNRNAKHPASSALTYTDSFHYMALNLTSLIKKSSVSKNFWRPEDVDFDLKPLSDAEVHRLPYSGECTAVPETGGGGQSPFANFGCGGPCNISSTVLALQSVYFHDSPIMLSQQWTKKFGAPITEEATHAALTTFKRQLMEDVYGTEYPTSDPKYGVKVAAFVNDAFDWTIQAASQGSAPLGLLGMLLLVAYAMIAFHRTPLKKSRYMLGFLGVISVFMGIGSGLGVASLIGIKFNTTSVQVLQFLMAGLGVDDMFILAASFYTFDDSVLDDHDLAGNCLSKIGPSITLTSITNIIAFGFGTMTPLPITVAFTQMCAICVFFIYANVVFVFTAVCAKHANMKRKDKTVLEKFEAELNNGVNWFARVYAHFASSIPGSVLIMISCTAFFYVIYENGYTKLVQGLSFEHLFAPGSKEADFWEIQDSYFGFMPFSIVTQDIDFAYQGPLLYQMQLAVEADECQDNTCLCANSVDPRACSDFHGNNGVHAGREADGIDIGIRLPFPTEREADCALAFGVWSDCVGSQYVYRRGKDKELLDSPELHDAAGADTRETDLCAPERVSTFAACKSWDIGYDKGKAVATGFAEYGDAEAFYNYHVWELPYFENECNDSLEAGSCKEPPQSWIRPYDNLVENLGITWMHVMLQWGLPCWYGLFYGPGEVLGETGFPVPRNIREQKDYCKQAFTSEEAYAIRCQDGFHGEDTDEFNNGKCGANYGFTWSNTELTVECCTAEPEEATSCVGEVSEARNCRDCKTTDGSPGAFTQYNKTEEEWEMGKYQKTVNGVDHMMVNNELSATMEMIAEYVFVPLGMDVTTEDMHRSDGNPGRVLSVHSPYLDIKSAKGTIDSELTGWGDADLVSGNFTFEPLANLFFPHEQKTENMMFKKHMWGEATDKGFTCDEHEYECEVVGVNNDTEMATANGGAVPDCAAGYEVLGNQCADDSALVGMGFDAGLFAATCPESCGCEKSTSHYPCVNKTDPEVFLSVCTAMPMYWHTCKAEDGIGWRGTGREPCWKGQEWVDIFNAASAVFQLAIHPEHFDRCMEEMINIDDRWKVLAPKFACKCTPEDVESGALPPNTCLMDIGKITDDNPNGYFTDCALKDRGTRELILPVKFTEVTMLANGLDDTQKYVELIKWTREVTEKFNERFKNFKVKGESRPFKVFPTGVPIIFWEQYVSLWDTIVSSMACSAGVVWFVMFVAFLFIQPESVKGSRLVATAMWTSVLLVLNLILISFSLLCLMGMNDIWLNGIPAMTLIASVGVAVEFTSHLTFAYLQVEGTSRERALTAVEHMFKPMLDGAFSTAISFFPLFFSGFIFVEKYFFLLYMVLTAGGLIVGLVLLPAMLALFGIAAMPDPNVAVVPNARRFSVSSAPIEGMGSRRLNKLMSRKDLHPDIMKNMPGSPTNPTSVVPIS